MFAFVKTGGKQYRVAKDDVISVEKLKAEPGDMVALDDVLMIGGDGKAPTVGQPTVDKAAVFAEVVEQTRGDKIIVFKKKRRQGYRRKNGHRQDLTVLKILEVSPTGTKPKAPKKAAAEPKPEDAAKPAEDEAKPAEDEAVEAAAAAPAEDVAPAEDTAATEAAPVEDAPPAEAEDEADEKPAKKADESKSEE